MIIITSCTALLLLFLLLSPVFEICANNLCWTERKTLLAGWRNKMKLGNMKAQLTNEEKKWHNNKRHQQQEQKCNRQRSCSSNERQQSHRDTFLKCSSDAWKQLPSRLIFTIWLLSITTRALPVAGTTGSLPVQLLVNSHVCPLLFWEERGPTMDRFLMIQGLTGKSIRPRHEA